MGTRCPRLQHAHHAVLDLAELDRLANAVGIAKNLLVGLVAQHDHRLRAFIGRGVPALAVRERHVEHAKELVRRNTHLRIERLHACALRDQQRAGLVHDHAACGGLRAVQEHRVAVGHQLRRVLGLVVVIRTIAAPGVHRDRIQLAALLRDRVGRHRVVDRERHRADGDAQRDREHHQRGESRMALQAVERQAQVVGKHGRASLPGSAVGRVGRRRVQHRD